MKTALICVLKKPLMIPFQMSCLWSFKFDVYKTSDFGKLGSKLS